MSVDLTDWGERRRGHLRMIRAPDGPRWRPADLVRHPMRAVPGRTDEVDLDRLVGELSAELRRRGLRFHRIPELGVVSEFGDDESAFRRRVLGVLRPELQRRAEEVGEAPGRLPPCWRRRAAEAGRRSQIELASRLSGLVESMETIECEDPWSSVQRVELGVLLIPEGLRTGLFNR